MSAIRVVLAEDQPMVRAGFRSVLDSRATSRSSAKRQQDQRHPVQRRHSLAELRVAAHHLEPIYDRLRVQDVRVAERSTLAAKLVADTDNLRKALRRKAAAIQAAVNGGRTAKACEKITDFVELVKDQSEDKRLTKAHATLLTNDANPLAAALGCPTRRDRDD